MMTEIEKAIARAKGLEQVRRVLEEVKLKVAWIDHVTDHEYDMVGAAHNWLEVVGITFAIDLKAHLEAHQLSIGPGNDREPVNVIMEAAA